MRSPAPWAGELRADVDPLNNTNFETGNLFGVWVAQGLTDPSHNYPYLLQGGLGMPDRDYYVSANAAHGRSAQAVPGPHRRNVQAGGLRGSASARAARVFALETKMAQVHATRVESEDVHAAVSWNRERTRGQSPRARLAGAARRGRTRRTRPSS